MARGSYESPTSSDYGKGGLCGFTRGMGKSVCDAASGEPLCFG